MPPLKIARYGLEYYSQHHHLWFLWLPRLSGDGAACPSFNNFCVISTFSLPIPYKEQNASTNLYKLFVMCHRIFKCVVFGWFSVGTMTQNWQNFNAYKNKGIFSISNLWLKLWIFSTAGWIIFTTWRYTVFIIIALHSDI